MSQFDAMYAPGGTGSGVGSSPAYTAGWRAFLEGFMVQHAIGTVLDVGCGDWQHSRLIDWGDRLYVGVDEVGPLVERLNAQYGSRDMRRDFRTTMPAVAFDLVICKDVMIHLPNAEVASLLERLSIHRHLLIVNDIAPVNVDCARGSYRPVDVTLPPFNLRADVVYRFPRLNNETKIVHHARNGG